MFIGAPFEKPNRKAGERPARSRHCKMERFRVYATGHVAGKVRRREEVEPGELPVQRSPFDLRGMGKGSKDRTGAFRSFRGGLFCLRWIDKGIEDNMRGCMHPGC